MLFLNTKPQQAAMKIQVAILLYCSTATAAVAQSTTKTESKTVNTSLKPNIAVSTGFNNNTGLLGFDVEVPLAKGLSLDGGFGLSSWGYKFTGSARYYLKPSGLNWAISCGFTSNTGLAGYKNDMETIYGTNEVVVLNLLPTSNFFIGAYKFVPIGFGKSRFYFNLGYSIPITSHYFTQVSGSPLSKNSERVIRILRPGGLIAGIGFTFAFKR